MSRWRKRTTLFERNDSIEIENFEGKLIPSIRWVNDCEYILKNYIRKTWLRKKSIE
jgi:hypothetical protein